MDDDVPAPVIVMGRNGARNGRLQLLGPPALLRNCHVLPWISSHIRQSSSQWSVNTPYRCVISQLNRRRRAVLSYSFLADLRDRPIINLARGEKKERAWSG